MSDGSGLAERIADDPEFEAALRALLDVDADTETWAFEDAPVDTGTFGRLVEQGIVEEAGDGYRLADPAAVRRALRSGREARDSDGTEAERRSGWSVGRPDVSTGALPAVGAALAVVALFVWTRAYIHAGVFRGGHVVLTGNDPYYYRYLLDRLLGVAGSPVELPALAGIPSGEPLFLATVWWVTALAGGGREAAGAVLAWYPVVAGLIVGALVYVLAARVLGDRRVGLAAAVSLALVPAFAFRTSLGFGDHHAFDTLWLTATVTVLAWLVTVDDPLGTRARRGAVLLGGCLAAQTLAWEGSPLLLVPVAGYLAAAVPLDVADDRPPLAASAPVLLGAAVAAVAVLAAHLALDWHSVTVAVVPALLLVGGTGLAAVGELVRRRDVTARALLAAEFGAPVAVLLLSAVAVPGLADDLFEGVGFLLFRSEIGEKAPTFTVGNALGLELLGAFVLLALPVMLWGLRRAALGDRQWLALSGYGWWLLLLTALQVRFAAHFAPLLALFAGLGFVWLLARLDLTLPPIADARADGEATDRPSNPGDGAVRQWIDTDALSVRSVAVTLAVVALLLGTSGVYLPDEVEGAVVDDESFQAATWMDAHAEDEGWTYPENYVLSRWGVNRMFNYFVSGESQSYLNAQDTYREFVYDDDPAAWYDRLHEETGFVVIQALPRRPGTIQQHLYVTYGSRWAEEGYDAVSHYRAVYASSSTRTKVFTLVPGATVTGSASANTTVEARTTVDVPNESFLYRQQAATGTDGEYRLVVPYAAEYELSIGNETRTVTVPESAVRNGTQVRAGE